MVFLGIFLSETERSGVRRHERCQMFCETGGICGRNAKSVRRGGTVGVCGESRTAVVVPRNTMQGRCVQSCVEEIHKRYREVGHWGLCGARFFIPITADGVQLLGRRTCDCFHLQGEIGTTHWHQISAARSDGHFGTASEHVEGCRFVNISSGNNGLAVVQRVGN